MKTEHFPPVWPIVTECPVKEKVTITSFRVEIFENIGFRCTCGLTKTEVLVPVYGSWIIYILLPLTTLSYFHRFFCVLCWRAKTIPIRNVWSSIFSQLRRRKKISFFRNIRIHVDTLNVTSYFIKSKKNTLSWNDVKRDKYCQTFLFPIFFPRKSLPSLRKQPPFHDVTTGSPAKWRLRNERRNSILMTRHYPDLGSLPLIGWSKCPMRHDQSEALPRSG